MQRCLMQLEMCGRHKSGPGYSSNSGNLDMGVSSYYPDMLNGNKHTESSDFSLQSQVMTANHFIQCPCHSDTSASGPAFCSDSCHGSFSGHHRLTHRPQGFYVGPAVFAFGNASEGMSCPSVSSCDWHTGWRGSDWAPRPGDHPGCGGGAPPG